MRNKSIHCARSLCRRILHSIIMVIVLNPFFHAQELDELIEMGIDDLMQIPIISASRHPQPMNKVPTTARVITADQIHERGYQTLEDVLADLPGFQFRNIQGFNSYVFLRGVPSQNNLILVFVDGVQLNELNSGGFYGGAQYNLSNVKQIEVISGPVSALYGTNAMSGIIHIATYDPSDENPARIQLRAGSFESFNTDFSIQSYNRDRDIGFRLSGMLNGTDKTDLGGANGDGNWTRDMENFEDNISFDGKVTAREWTVGFLFQDKQVIHPALRLGL